MASLAEQRVFAFWLGDNPMSQRRQESLNSLERTGAEVVFLTLANINAWIKPEAPLHPAFEYLTPVHRADYLRTYLMHHHGGGYSDVKPTSASWLEAFNVLNSQDWMYGIGSPEKSPHGVAVIGWRRRFYCRNYPWLLGNGFYIFKPDTPFTRAWYREVVRRLDRLLPALRESPGRQPKERPGREYDGVVSQYPVRWAYLLGEIFHPLCYRYRHRLGRTLPPALVRDYE